MESHLSSMERCPDDILFKIKEQLSSSCYLQVLLALRLTSRRLHSFFTPFTITWPRRFDWYVEEQLLTNGKSIFIAYNGYDMLPLVEPVPDAFIPSILSLRVNFGVKITSSSLSPATVAEIIDSLSPCWEEISRYKALKSLSLSLKWNGEQAGLFHQHLADRTLQTVHKVSGGQLRGYLNVRYPLNYHAARPISGILPFRGMHSISISIPEGSYHEPPGFVLPSLLGRIVENNPGLQSVVLSCGSSHCLCKLEELFPTALKEWSIRELDVSGVLPDAPMSPPRSSLNYPLMKDLQRIHLSGLPNHKVNLDGLWHTLKISGARLTNVKLNYAISETLMAYLASYEGLKKVEIEPLSSTLPSSSTSFTKQVLPRHASSLTSLQVFANRATLLSDISWQVLAFDPTTWPTPPKFLSLTYLEALTPETWDLDAQTLQRTLDYASDCPNLQNLLLTWTKPGLDSSISSLEDMKRIGQEVAIRRSALQRFVNHIRGGRQGVAWCISWGGEETRCQLSQFKLIW